MMPAPSTGLDQVGRITDDGFAVVDDPEVEIIIELIGGYSPAKTWFCGLLRIKNTSLPLIRP